MARKELGCHFFSDSTEAFRCDSQVGGYVIVLDRLLDSWVHLYKCEVPLFRR